MKKLNLENKKFGKLIALNDIGVHRNGSRLWKCRCECGNFTIALAGDLNNGKRKSCGCTSKIEGIKKRLPNGLAGFNALYAHYKRYGKYGFFLSKKEFHKLTQKNCYYCGGKPQQKKTAGHHTKASPYVYNGLDRIDNLKGYTSDNCVPCCGICNRMKGTMTEKDFLHHIKQISKRRR